MAASNVTNEAIWLRILLEEMGFKQVSFMSTTKGVSHLHTIPSTTHTRNTSASGTAISKDAFLARKSTYSTENMLADIFTKQLLRNAFEKFRDALGVGVTNGSELKEVSESR